MSTATRKSSLGGRSKAHIPFRADEPGLGRKTGLAVPRVPHMSDEFEPFNEVLRRGDPTPPRPTRKRRSSAYRADDDDADFGGYGEQSMELDETPIRRPVKDANQYPDSSRISRTVNRSTDVDYDSIPSPPSKSASRRQSFVSGASSSALPDDDDLGLGNYDGDYGYEDEEDVNQSTYSRASNATPHRLASATPRRRSSFSEMNLDDREEEEEDDVVTSARTLDKGKGRAIEPDPLEDEQDTEDYIAGGLQETENMPSDGDRDVESPPRRTPPKKKQRGHPATRSSLSNGLRRGTRMRYPPLEWWRNEKVVYGKRENGIAYCPIVKAIVRVPKEPVKPLGKAGKKSRTPRPVRTDNPEEGWDDKTPLTGVVVDWQTKEEVQRRIAFPSAHVEYRAAENDSFYFQKIFGDGEYIAAGQLLIRPGGEKPTKGTKDNTYVFYIIEGAVTFKIHETSYILCTGGSILVPRGNVYYIENIADRDAKLFFAQARRIVAEEEEPPDLKPASAMPSQTPDPERHARRKRSSSTGTPAAQAPKKTGPPKHTGAKKS
ncbi:Mif2/CENP-C like-domain-containing protein [Vararia minispora EC-137]|uniref:Mif2/CENP-C like-domain-containing protein n=1 Tax=Vararia minispora EC-137 TaxID=1314806 RepID=A0ACB8QI34_9AGAM|nr:Mif2/CENP-C like-domain-containing protein [Vararia minispora EC-137]